MLFTRSCLDELRTCQYLSDTIIEFYFNYMSTVYTSDLITLVPPTISYMIANSVDPAARRECIADLKITEKDLVIFPVNEGHGGGRHWSVLVFYRKQSENEKEKENHVFVHHDSMNGINHFAAYKLFRAIKGHVIRHKKKKMKMSRRIMRFANLPFFDRDDDNDNYEAVFRPFLTPQQTNHYDCGLYVMAITKMICHWFCDGELVKDSEWLWLDEIRENVVNVALESTLRPRLLRLIQEASCGRLGSLSCTIEPGEERYFDYRHHQLSPNKEEAGDINDFGATPKEEAKGGAARFIGIDHQPKPMDRDADCGTSNSMATEWAGGCGMSRSMDDAGCGMSRTMGILSYTNIEGPSTAKKRMVPMDVCISIAKWLASKQSRYKKN